MVINDGVNTFLQQGFRPAMILAFALACFAKPASVDAQCQDFPAPLVWSAGNPNIVEGPLPIIVVDPEFGDLAAGVEGAVAFDGCGRFMVAWQISNFPSDGPQFLHNSDTILIQRYLPAGTEDGVFDRLTKDQPDPPISALQPDNREPSIAISPNGNVRVGWIGTCPDCRNTVTQTDLNVFGAASHSDFLFDESPAITPVPLAPLDADHRDVSVGMSDNLALGRLAWSSDGSAPTGLLEGQALGAANVIRACNPLCFADTWKPSLAMRPNGDYCVAWAEAEDPIGFPFNIALRVYGAGGTLIDEIAGPGADQWVNKPATEPVNSSLVSPAVAFDAQGNIVVTWAGLDFESSVRVFARRFHWAGVGSQIVANSEPFFVDNDPTPGTMPSGFEVGGAHPTVALVQDSPAFPAVHPGRFIIAWNSDVGAMSPTKTEVHAQYFDSDGRPMGREFRVNQADGVTGTDNLNLRKLAESGQHTIAYGGAGHAVFVWTACTGSSLDFDPCGISDVYYTLLPVDFAEAMDMAAPCCKGDANHDNVVDGKDMKPLVDMLLNPPVPFDIFTYCEFDTNNDGALTIDDVPGFVDAMFAGTCSP